jgi:hypothetical protein
MSHFSQVKTRLTDKTILKKALTQMGFTIVEEEKPVEVRGFFGASIPAEFKILTKTHYDIGFVKTEDGSYEVVGDWELLPSVSQIERDIFLPKLKREYAVTAIQDLAKKQGYELEYHETESSENIEMVVSQW